MVVPATKQAHNPQAYASIGGQFRFVESPVNYSKFFQLRIKSQSLFPQFSTLRLRTIPWDAVVSIVLYLVIYP